MEIRQHICGYSSILFFLKYNSIFNLCHFSMTPLCTITQHINDAPYTTPAKTGLKIEARVYCGNVISGRGLFRLGLNTPLQMSDCPICVERICSIRFPRNTSFPTTIFTSTSIVSSMFFKFFSRSCGRHYCHV